MAEVYDAPLEWTGDVATPLKLFNTRVREAWIDEYEHVNIAHYLTICDHANWAFWNWINGPSGTIDARDGHEYAIVENHVHYLDELALGAEIEVTTQLLAFDAKRFILFHHVVRKDNGAVAATNEVKFLGFNLKERRAEAWSDTVSDRLAQVLNAHEGLECPPKAGSGIALSSRR